MLQAEIKKLELLQCRLDLDLSFLFQRPETSCEPCVAGRDKKVGVVAVQT
jgi:hypothetical protein